MVRVNVCVNIKARNLTPLKYMEPVTVVLGLAAIIGSGALTKVSLQFLY
jgi:hypothetical protein